MKPHPHIDELQRSASAGYPRGHYLRLDRNELVPDITQEVFEGIMRRLSPTTFTCYPATGPLYDALAAKTGQGQANILIGAGSDWLIRNIFDVFCVPGTRVVMPTPTYGMYEVYAKINQAELVTIDYEADLSFPAQAVLAAMADGVGIVALANPNGAIGSAIPHEVLTRILEAARSSNALVIVDEAYVEYVDADCGIFIDDFPNLLVVRTFSKALGLAGLRVGYALGNASLIRSVAKLRPNVEINQVAVEAALYLLENEQLVLDHVRAGLSGKEHLSKCLRDLGFEVYEGHANFLQTKLGVHRSRILERLRSEEILVKDEQDPILSDWTRITIGPEQEMDRVVDCVRSEMKNA
ncbi:pyridoxal phosphate-dependent aminotransferase [Streptomyces sp. NPDC051362]|uniref:pyridoxal phosphate-dependent aminotransferase n=1 Tax=Streptomyces sp. NPDC051362 TaxID=3365651 RepID=UPI0037B78379